MRFYTYKTFDDSNNFILHNKLQISNDFLSLHT